MKKLLTNKWVIVAAIVALLVIAGAVILFVIGKKRTEDPVEDGGGNNDPAPSTSGGTVLRYGSRGENVRKLQQFLNGKLIERYYIRGNNPQYQGNTINSLVEDGIFGPKTQCVTRWYFDKDTVTVDELV